MEEGLAEWKRASLEDEAELALKCFRRPRDLLLFIVSSYFEHAVTRWRLLRRLLADSSLRAPDTLDHKAHSVSQAVRSCSSSLSRWNNFFHKLRIDAPSHFLKVTTGLYSARLQYIPNISSFHIFSAFPFTLLSSSASRLLLGSIRNWTDCELLQSQWLCCDCGTVSIVLTIVVCCCDWMGNGS